MWYSVLVGLILAAVTISIHATGTAGLIQLLRRPKRPIPPSNRHGRPLRRLCIVAIFLLLLHISEVVVWASVYLLVLHNAPFATFEESVYFSTVTFTSLGYGDVVIEGKWRLLGAIQSMVGLLVFGWSSALLFALVQRILNPAEFGDHDRPE